MTSKAVIDAAEAAGRSTGRCALPCAGTSGDRPTARRILQEGDA